MSTDIADSRAQKAKLKVLQYNRRLTLYSHDLYGSICKMFVDILQISTVWWCSMMFYDLRIECIHIFQKMDRNIGLFLPISPSQLLLGKSHWQSLVEVEVLFKQVWTQWRFTQPNNLVSTFMSPKTAVLATSIAFRQAYGTKELDEMLPQWRTKNQKSLLLLERPNEVHEKPPQTVPGHKFSSSKEGISTSKLNDAESWLRLCN